MTDLILRPTGNTGLTGAVAYTEGTLPQIITGLAAGTYDVGRLVYSGTPITVTAAPTFTPRGANFDGTARYAGSGVNVTTAQSGLMSFWFKNRQTSWNTPSTCTLLQFRNGTVANISISLTSSGRLSFTINQTGGGPNTFTVASSTFVINTWYHICWAWVYDTVTPANSRFQIAVNRTLLNTAAYTQTTTTGAIHAASNITQVGIAATSSSSGILACDIGHLLFDPTRTLNLTTGANLDKFITSGTLQPVDLGADGSTPFGAQPAFYYDGAGAAWGNLGTAGNVALTGTLTACSPVPGS